MTGQVKPLLDYEKTFSPVPYSTQAGTTTEQFKRFCQWNAVFEVVSCTFIGILTNHILCKQPVYRIHYRSFQ